MPSIGIIVADGARARFITFQPPDELTPGRGTNLIEHSDLINPEGDLPARELFSDRAGRTHGSPVGSAHGPADQASARWLGAHGCRDRCKHLRSRAGCGGELFLRAGGR